MQNSLIVQEYHKCLIPYILHLKHWFSNYVLDPFTLNIDIVVM